MPVDLTRLVTLGVSRVSLEDMGVMLRPHEFPPRGAFYLDHKVFPVVAAGAVDVIVFQYLVPAFRQGVMRRLAVEPNDPAAIPSISWSIKRSGTPVQDYQQVPSPIGSVAEPDWVVVEFDRQQLMQVTVSNSAFFPYDVSVRVVGWFWDIVKNAGR